VTRVKIVGEVKGKAGQVSLRLDNSMHRSPQASAQSKCTRAPSRWVRGIGHRTEHLFSTTIFVKNKRR
jgi:hypothetical protein